MADRIYLVNVGANASHRFASPVFPDRSFEFLPIPENEDIPGDHVVRFGDLRSFNNPLENISHFVPRYLWEWPAHNDPEFDTFTYGDNCDNSPRAASLKRIQRGDYILFLARMVGASAINKSKDPQIGSANDLQKSSGVGLLGHFGFYLVGYIKVADVLKRVLARPSSAILRRYGANAHIRKGMESSLYWNGFWIFCGSNKSRRFRKAVPVTRQLSKQVFTSADGTPWEWSKNRTDLQVIGSYTRSVRCVIDTAIPGHAKRADFLWNWIGQFSE